MGIAVQCSAFNRLLLPFHPTSITDSPTSVLVTCAFDQFVYQMAPTHPKLAMNMFLEIIKAVQYLHKKGIAHRNIILEHVLVTKRNIPKLTGFKFAIAFNGVNLIDKHVGVGSYLPPEVLSRQPYDPFKADVWSLGVVLFALTNDGFPFHRVVSDQVNSSGPH